MQDVVRILREETGKPALDRKVALGLVCCFPLIWHDRDRDCVRGLCHSAVCAMAVRLGLDYVRRNTSKDHPMKDYGRVQAPNHFPYLTTLLKS